ncbi:MAG: dephospho-CoA kinase [Ginsengibacter sp.]
MLKIGLTGGIGSGKTTVARIFEVLGIPVYYADDAAKKLMNEDGDLKNSIIKAFGTNAYFNSKLNREFLSNVVFNDIEKLNVLNSIVHPATINDAIKWFKNQNSSYVIKEAALIFESGSQKELDFVIGIKSPVELRIQRAMSRDHISAEQVQSRMNKQMDEDEKMRLCDYVIVNDEQEMLIPQVLTLHERFLKLATSTR